MSANYQSDLDYERGTERAERIMDLPAWSCIKLAIAELPLPPNPMKEPSKMNPLPTKPAPATMVPVTVTPIERDPMLNREIARFEKLCRSNWSTQYACEHLEIARAATALHLADLKRAGHSPKQTEFVITSEPGVRFMPAHIEDRSYCGSSAATCAGF